MRKLTTREISFRDHFTYGSIFRFVMPTVLMMLFTSMYGVVDGLYVNNYVGKHAFAAVTLITPLPLLIGAFAYMIGGGGAAIIAQELARGEKKKAGRYFTSLTCVSIIGAVILSFFGEIFLGPLAELMGADQEMLPVCLDYGRILIFSIPFYVLQNVFQSFLTAAEKPKIGLAINLFSAAVNLFLDYLFVGVFDMGVTGAAIASLTSQVLNLLLILLFFRMANRRIGKTFRFDLNLGKAGYLQYVAMLMPILINEFLWSLGQNVNTYLYGHLGTWPLAAMALTGPVQGLLFGALSGISQAAGILVGKRLGEREYEAAYQESKQLMLYGLVGSLALSALLAVLSWPYANIYNVEPEVKEIARWLLIALAVLAPVKVQNMVLGGGIIRSGGKTKYIMIIDTVGTWLVGVPLGFLTTFVFKLNIVWVYFILSQEELVRYIITVFMFRSRRWMETIE